MRKVPVLTAVIIGAALGLCTAIFDSGGLKIVMMLIGALAGTAVGSAVSRGRRRFNWRTFQQLPLTDTGLLSEERIRTYWRDKGHICPMPGHPDPEGATHDLPHVP